MKLKNEDSFIFKFYTVTITKKHIKKSLDKIIDGF